MHILGVLLIGFLVGLVARFFMPGKQGLGIIMTTVLGIIGAVVGTYIGQALGWYAEGEPAGFIASVFGAMVVLFVAKLLSKK
ncbi:GlsB/YeaQ/YmgE family stress response membrane protein [Bdellovibrio sp. KM01]|uniref:GlsB/YeaQ/YmgE family stress response membrane protein n=1 Tax=Bdellovibrio sp. KM01 TaxID=2748865 RepID=UPI0015EA9ED5|nr:GlsB/YeaQ/YmgE family stress response membrane protein [Bdellovibrio sp. KM01]QLY23884.1 GlsB/YeaQ/YmgE family stress response membrane protein [Bdellovibrio sp. KM01]